MKKVNQFIKDHGIEILVGIIVTTALIVSIFTQDGGIGSWTWTLLNNVNIIVGFITALIAYSTWRTTRILRGNFDKKVKYAKKQSPTHAVVLGISCGTNDITSDVKEYTNEKTYIDINTPLIGAEEIQHKYKRKNSYINAVNIDAHFISLKLKNMPEDEKTVGEFMKEYATALEDICGLCKYNSIHKIYLFVSAPMPVVFLAGEKFHNKFLVYTHHHVKKNENEVTGKEESYIMTTCDGFETYVDKDKLFDFSS